MQFTVVNQFYGILKEFTFRGILGSVRWLSRYGPEISPWSRAEGELMQLGGSGIFKTSITITAASFWTHLVTSQRSCITLPGSTGP